MLYPLNWNIIQVFIYINIYITHIYKYYIFIIYNIWKAYIRAYRKCL